MRVITSVCEKIEFSGLGWYVEHGEIFYCDDFCEWAEIDYLDPFAARRISDEAAALRPGQILLIGIED